MVLRHDCSAVQSYQLQYEDQIYIERVKVSLFISRQTMENYFSRNVEFDLKFSRIGEDFNRSDRV